jgi:glyoxylase-like metal-dependent hydrolase (beta-lactamase superfamily II)
VQLAPRASGHQEVLEAIMSDKEDWGTLFVTRKCCGAATCRNFAPELLGEVAPSHALRDDGGAGGHGPLLLPGSYEEGSFTGVLRQPRDKADLEAARTAVAACPFGAIQLRPPAGRVRPGELGKPWRAFPQRIEDEVWVLGNPSQKNFGALAYFIERPSGGVLIDLPRPSEELYRWLEERGGVRWIFLTHRDHAKHHDEFAARFPGCRRILGAADVDRRATEYMADTSGVEIKVGDGPDPLSIDGTPLSEDALAGAELAVLPQPGHTKGSLCLLYRGRFLFTGDHLTYSHHLGRIVAHRLQCWDDWERQTHSVRRLAEWAESGRLRFTWLLPGHGEWHRFEGDGKAASPAAALREAVEWMERKPPGHTPLGRWIPFVQSRTAPRGKLARAVRAVIGQEANRDTWILPRAVRPILPDYDPRAASAARRRASVLAAAAGLAAAGVVWLAARAAGARE